jgi:hypothetical protein
MTTGRINQITIVRRTGRHRRPCFRAAEVLIIASRPFFRAARRRTAPRLARAGGTPGTSPAVASFRLLRLGNLRRCRQARPGHESPEVPPRRRMRRLASPKSAVRRLSAGEYPLLLSKLWPEASRPQSPSSAELEDPVPQFGMSVERAAGADAAPTDNGCYEPLVTRVNANGLRAV